MNKFNQQILKALVVLPIIFSWNAFASENSCSDWQRDKQKIEKALATNFEVDEVKIDNFVLAPAAYNPLSLLFEPYRTYRKFNLTVKHNSTTEKLFSCFSNYHSKTKEFKIYACSTSEDMKTSSPKSIHLGRFEKQPASEYIISLKDIVEINKIKICKEKDIVHSDANSNDKILDASRSSLKEKDDAQDETISSEQNGTAK